MRKAMAVTALVALALAAPAVAAAQDTPTVEATVAAGVEDMMPVGEASQFPADVGQVYLWTRVTGAAGASISHVWIHPDGTEYPVTLQIGGSPWRTWSSKTIPPEWAGEWRVEVRDAAGSVLATEAFTVGG